MSDWLDKVIAMIAQGTTDEKLEDIARTALTEIDAEIRQMQHQASLIRDLVAHYGPVSASGKNGNPPLLPTSPADNSNGPQRHALIHDAALEVTRGVDTVHVGTISEELLRRGYVFSRSNQRVGTVLQFHPTEFRPIGGGHWQVLWWQQEGSTND